MRVLVCTVDVDPCPTANVATMALVDVFNPSSLGITTDTVFYVYSWGAAAVLGMFCAGYAVAAAVGLIRRL